MTIIVTARLVKPLDTNDTEEIRIVIRNNDAANPYVRVTNITPILKIVTDSDDEDASTVGDVPTDKYSFHPDSINELSFQQLSELNGANGVELTFHLSTGGSPPPDPIDEGNYHVNLEMDVSLPAPSSHIGAISSSSFPIEEEDDNL